MLLIGLTGSIATGKSTVSKILSQPPYSLPIIDADLLARKVVEPGSDPLNLDLNSSSKSALTNILTSLTRPRYPRVQRHREILPPHNARPPPPR
jgi:dephospho-CoA kinase